MTYQVETGDIAISDALIQIAKDNNNPVFIGLTDLENRRHWSCLIIKKNGQLDWNHELVDQYTTVTVAEFIKLLKQEQLITVDGHIVLFKDEEIEISGLIIDNKTVDEIHARLHQNKRR